MFIMVKLSKYTLKDRYSNTIKVENCSKGKFFYKKMILAMKLKDVYNVYNDKIDQVYSKRQLK